MRASLALVCLPLAVFPFAACGGSSTDGGSTTPHDGGTPGDDGGTTGDDGGTTGDDGGTTNDASKPMDSGPPFMPAAHPPYPMLPNNGGGVLNNMTIVTIVASNEDPTVAQSLFGLADSFMTGTYFAAVGADYGLGTPSGSVHITGAAITSNPSPNQMTQYIAQSIQGHTIGPKPFYMLYLPEGIWDTDGQGGVNTNGQLGHCGYHSVMGGGAPWGMAVHCPGLSRIQAMGVFGSHEIIEGASDPNPPSGWHMPNPSQQQPWLSSPWTSPSQGENGDLCTGTSTYVAGFKLQRIWSNTAAARGGDPCVPAIPETYYNAFAPQGWYTVARGGSVQIPITGYSDKARSDWYVDASATSQSTSGWTLAVTGSKTATVGGRTVALINNGTSATLTVTAPNAATGSWLNLWLISESPTGGSDQYHWWPVGVHIQ